MKRYLSSMMVVMMFLMCFTGVTGGMVKADEVNPEFIYDFEDVTITDGTGEIDTSKFVGVGSPPADKQAIIDSSDVVYENGTEGNKVLEIPTTSSPFYIYNKALHTTLGTNKYQVYEIAVKLPEGIPSSSEQYHQFQVGLFGSDWAANTGGTYALIQDYKLKEGGATAKILGSSEDFEFLPDTWYVVRRVVRFDTNPNTASTYVYDSQGNRLASVDRSSSAGTIELDAGGTFYTRSWRCYISGITSPIMLDDIKFYSLSEPVVTANDLNNADINTSITATFSKPVNASDLTVANVTLQKDGVAVTGKHSISDITDFGCTVNLTELDYDSTYTLTFTSGVRGSEYKIPVIPKSVIIQTEPEPVFGEDNPQFSYDFEGPEYETVPTEVDTSVFTGTSDDNIKNLSVVDYESGTSGNKVLKIPDSKNNGPFYMYNKALHRHLGTKKYQVYECAIKLPANIPPSSEAYHQIQLHNFGSDWSANNGGTYILLQDYKLREDYGNFAKTPEGNDFVFSPDTWYVVRRLIRFDTNPNTASTYIYDLEGNRLASVNRSAGAGEFGLTTDGDATFYSRTWKTYISGITDPVMIDNVKFYSLEQPIVTAEDVNNAEPNTSIVVSFNQPVNIDTLTLDNLTLMKGDTDATDKISSISNVTSEGCTVHLTNLNYESTYALIFGEGIKSIAYDIPVAQNSITISTRVTPFKVTSLKLYSGSEEVTGSPGLGSTIYAKALVDNNLQDVQDARVILALYKDGRLQGVAFSEPTEVAIGANEFEITTDDITVPASGCIAQMMVWDSLGDMHPLSEVTYIPTE